MTDISPAENATAKAGDITEQQAAQLIREIDPNGRFAFSVHRTVYYLDTAKSPTITFHVIATAADEQQSDQGKNTLADAMQSLMEKVGKSPAQKAVELREQAANIIARAEALEATSNEPT